MRYLILYIAILSSLFSQKIDVYNRPFQEQPDFDIDVLHYDINLNLYDHIKSFTGKTSVKFKVLKSDLNTIKLNIETVEVTSVFEKNKKLKFRQKNGLLIINPKRAISKNDIITYTIFYDSKGKLSDPTKFGMNVLLGLGFFDKTDDNPNLAQTHSFPTGARHWFPSNDHPADKATSTISATVKSEWKVLANGLLIDKSVKKDSATYTWDLTLPNSTYLYVMVAGPFEIINDFHGKIPISYWVYPNDKEDAMRSFHRTSEILGFFEKEYGVPYPWPKMDQITIPAIGGGAESTTATILGQSTIHDAKAEKDFPSHWLVAHEAAHHWWGDYITMRNWHHAWLNESFGTYGEYLYRAHSKGLDEGKFNLWKKKQSYLNEYNNRYSRPMVHPYWKWPNQNFDSHIYPRGAAVLHMLRNIIGNKNMKAFQKKFLTEYAYGNPETNDLIRVVNETTGKDMTWFFDQWVYGAGHPQLEVDTYWDEGVLTVKIDQTQSGTKVPSIYKIPMSIDFYFKNRIINKTILIEGKNTVHRFNFKQEPTLVRLDPDDVLLLTVNQPKTVDGLLVQLKRDNVIGRHDAAILLSNHLDFPKVENTLKRSALYDKSWFVRQSSLQSISTKLSGKDWKLAYEREKHSQPRKTIISLMSKFYPKRALRLIRENLKDDNSYIVQAEMIRQLGLIGDRSDIEIIEKLLPQRSPRKIIQNAARSSISNLKG